MDAVVSCAYFDVADVSRCCMHLLQDVCIVELREPTGWVVVPLAATQASKHLRAFHLQVSLTCHSSSDLAGLQAQH